MSKLNGLIQLIQTAVDEGTTAVETVHKTILSQNYNKVKIILPFNKVTENIQQLQVQSTESIYKIIRLVNQETGNLVQSVIENVEKTKYVTSPNLDPEVKQTKKTFPPPKPTEIGISILNGIFGDYLHKAGNTLATPMAFYHDGRPMEMSKQSLKKTCPEPSSKICILVHGLVCNETIWNYDESQTTYGSLLQKDLDYTPFYLRYNSGLHISENGKMFSKSVSALIRAYPRKVDEIIMIGHSMGGLVIRSGCWYGKEHGDEWVNNVKKCVYIAAPHHGAPLEKFGNLFSGLLKQLPLAYTRLAGGIIDIRSSGIKDLRYGYVVDDEWKGYHPDAVLKNKKNRVALLEGVSHYAISGSLTKNPDHFMTKLFGDPIVRKSSALGITKKEGFNLPLTDYRVFAKIGHLKLAHCPEVYRQIIKWCREAVDAPAERDSVNGGMC